MNWRADNGGFLSAPLASSVKFSSPTVFGLADHSSTRRILLDPLYPHVTDALSSSKSSFQENFRNAASASRDGYGTGASEA
jgi:hypothetical protein